MRKRGRRDANHGDIRQALRSMGATVADTADLGGGFGDLVVGAYGLNVLVEVKDGSRPPSERKLTDDEREFHAAWRGRIVVVETVDEAVSLVRGMLAASQAAARAGVSFDFGNKRHE